MMSGSSPRPTQQTCTPAPRCPVELHPQWGALPDTAPAGDDPGRPRIKHCPHCSSLSSSRHLRGEGRAGRQVWEDCLTCTPRWASGGSWTRVRASGYSARSQGRGEGQRARRPQEPSTSNTPGPPCVGLGLPWGLWI